MQYNYDNTYTKVSPVLPSLGHERLCCAAFGPREVPEGAGSRTLLGVVCTEYPGH